MLQRLSAKRQDYWSPHKISGKQKRVHWILIPHPSGAEQSWGVKLGLGGENAVKASWLILRRAVVTLMIRRVHVLRLVPLTPTHSGQALRNLRITSALFVCWKERKRETLFLDRDGQGHLQAMSAKQRGKRQRSPAECSLSKHRFFVTHPVWCFGLWDVGHPPLNYSLLEHPHVQFEHYSRASYTTFKSLLMLYGLISPWNGLNQPVCHSLGIAQHSEHYLALGP